MASFLECFRQVDEGLNKQYVNDINVILGPNDEFPIGNKLEILYEKIKSSGFFIPSAVSLGKNYRSQVSYGEYDIRTITMENFILIRGYFHWYVKKVIVLLGKMLDGVDADVGKIKIHPPPNPNCKLPNSLSWQNYYEPFDYFDSNRTERVQEVSFTDEQCILYVQSNPMFGCKYKRYATAYAAARSGRPRVLRECLKLGWPIKQCIDSLSSSLPTTIVVEPHLKNNLLENVLSNYHCKVKDALEMIDMLVEYGAKVDEPLEHHGYTMTPVQVCDKTIKYLSSEWDGVKWMNPKDNAEKISFMEEVKKRLLYHIEKQQNKNED